MFVICVSCAQWPVKADCLPDTQEKRDAATPAMLIKRVSSPRIGNQRKKEMRRAMLEEMGQRERGCRLITRPVRRTHATRPSFSSSSSSLSSSSFSSCLSILILILHLFFLYLFLRVLLLFSFSFQYSFLSSSLTSS